MAFGHAFQFAGEYARGGYNPGPSAADEAARRERIRLERKANAKAASNAARILEGGFVYFEPSS